MKEQELIISLYKFYIQNSKIKIDDMTESYREYFYSIATIDVKKILKISKKDVKVLSNSLKKL